LEQANDVVMADAHPWADLSIRRCRSHKPGCRSCLSNGRLLAVVLHSLPLGIRQRRFAFEAGSCSSRLCCVSTSGVLASSSMKRDVPWDRPDRGKVGGSCLEDGEDADEHLCGAFHEQSDEGIGSDACCRR